VTCAKCKRRTCGANTFSDHMHVRKDFSQWPTPAEFETDVTITAQVSSTGHDEITEAAQSRQCVPASTFG